MRDPERIPKILQKLQAAWEQVPDWRLGQLVENVKAASEGRMDTFYIEDDQMERGLDELLDQLRGRGEG